MKMENPTAGGAAVVRPVMQPQMSSQVSLSTCTAAFQHRAGLMGGSQFVFVKQMKVIPNFLCKNLLHLMFLLPFLFLLVTQGCFIKPSVFFYLDSPLISCYVLR
jgi:hypothetical protein